MRDEDKSKDELIRELRALRQYVAEVETTTSDCQQMEVSLQAAKLELESQVEERTAALRGSNDQLIAEVAERQQAENALQAAKDQLQAVLDAVPGIVSWISSDLRYLGVNRHLAKTFNLPPETFAGQDIGFLRTSPEFYRFVQELFTHPTQDSYCEISAIVNGSPRIFLIMAQKYDQDRAAFTVGIDITERRQAEDGLRQAEAKYRSIFENAVEGIFQTTPDGHYISANPAIARIYGYDSPQELMNKLVSIQQQLYLDPDRRAEFVWLLQEDDAVIGFESEIYRKDGSTTWISENARAVRDPDGILLYYEGTVEDISARKQAQEALQKANEELELRVEERTAALRDVNQRLVEEITERQRVGEALQASEAELRALFAAMTDNIVVFNAEGRYLRIVPTNSEVLYNPDVPRLQSTVYGVLPPDKAALFVIHIQRALNTGQTVNLEYSLPVSPCAVSGHQPLSPETGQPEAWYAASVSPMQNGQVLWVARNITERKMAEQALRRAEEKYRSIFEHAAEGIFQTTPDGRCISANPALVQMYGYDSAADLINQITDLEQQLYVDPNRRAEFIAALEQHDVVNNFEAQVYRKDGSIIWTAENARAVRDDQGTLLYYEGTVRDITKRRQAEQALSESQRTLATLMSNLPGMAYRCNNDLNWTMQFVSEGCWDLTGYQREDLMDNRQIAYSELIHPEDRGLVWQEVQMAMSQQRPFQTVYRIITAQQTQKWVWEQGRAVFATDGRPLLEGFIADITERKQAEIELQAEREKSERLLINILPQAIAEQLKQKQDSIADRFDEVTILFADIVDFTGLAAQVSPSELVNLLNQIFSTFDQLAELHGLEKIKTIGDAYMVVGGLPTPRVDHAAAIAEMALDIQTKISHFRRANGAPFAVRIGINTGPVIAGVIGIKKFIYDLWGDTVNVASRMEAQGIGGQIQVTSDYYELLKDQYQFEKRGAIAVKGKGKMTTYWMKGRR